jgi:hypothetical protein
MVKGRMASFWSGSSEKEGSGRNRTSMDNTKRVKKQKAVLVFIIVLSGFKRSLFFGPMAAFLDAH